jgi:hypothetical protein
MSLLEEELKKAIRTTLAELQSIEYVSVNIVDYRLHKFQKQVLNNQITIMSALADIHRDQYSQFEVLKSIR